MVTRQLLMDVVTSSSPEAPLVIGGDFAASPSQVAGWLEDYPQLEVVSTGVPTCHVGGHSSELDFFVVGRSLLHLFKGVAVVESAVATHAAVTLRIETEGAAPLLEWVRPKAPDVRRVFGPQLQAAGERGASLSVPPL